MTSFFFSLQFAVPSNNTSIKVHQFNLLKWKDMRGIVSGVAQQSRCWRLSTDWQKGQRKKEWAFFCPSTSTSWQWTSHYRCGRLHYHAALSFHQQPHFSYGLNPRWQCGFRVNSSYSRRISLDSRWALIWIPCLTRSNANQRMKYFISSGTVWSFFFPRNLSKQQNIVYVSCISVLNIHHSEQKAKLQHSKINLALHCNALCIKKTDHYSFTS